MIEKIKKHQQAFLIGLIVIFMAPGAVVYLQKIKDKLKDNAIQDVMAEGDILLRSVWRNESEIYDNIFDALSDTHGSQVDIDAFRASLDMQETDSIVFTGDGGSYIYTFAPSKAWTAGIYSPSFRWRPSRTRRTVSCAIPRWR